jgi:hypothetical protein
MGGTYWNGSSRWGGMDWTDLSQNMDRWHGFVNEVMNLRVPQNAGNFLISWRPVSFLQRTLPHGVRQSVSQSFWRYICFIPHQEQVGFQDLSAVALTLSNLLNVNWRLTGTCYLHADGSRFLWCAGVYFPNYVTSCPRSQLSWRWPHIIPCIIRT